MHSYPNLITSPLSDEERAALNLRFASPVFDTWPNVYSVLHLDTGEAFLVVDHGAGYIDRASANTYEHLHAIVAGDEIESLIKGDSVDEVLAMISAAA